MNQDKLKELLANKDDVLKERHLSDLRKLKIAIFNVDWSQYPGEVDLNALYVEVEKIMLKINEHLNRPRLPVVKRSDLHPPYELPGFMTLNQWNAQHVKDGVQITLWVNEIVPALIARDGRWAKVPNSPWCARTGHKNGEIVYHKDTLKELHDEIMSHAQMHCDMRTVTLTT